MRRHAGRCRAGPTVPGRCRVLRGGRRSASLRAEGEALCFEEHEDRAPRRAWHPTKGWHQTARMRGEDARAEARMSLCLCRTSPDTSEALSHARQCARVTVTVPRVEVRRTVAHCYAAEHCSTHSHGADPCAEQAHSHAEERGWLPGPRASGSRASGCLCRPGTRSRRGKHLQVTGAREPANPSSRQGHVLFQTRDTGVACPLSLCHNVVLVAFVRHVPRWAGGGLEV